MNILLADDDKLLSEIISDFLEMQKSNVKTAYDGQQGIDLCAKYEFDLAIVDIFMPVKDGLELMSEIKNNYPHIKVIAISGMGREGSEAYKSALSCGARVVLEKPFNLSKLQQTIQDVTAPL